MATPTTTPPRPLPVGAWLAALGAIGAVAVVMSLAPDPVPDFTQQQPLVWALARLDLRHAFDGDFQTSGPGFGFAAAPIYRLARIGLSPEDAYRLLGVFVLAPLAVATISASRALGTVARSSREVAVVALVVLGFPIQACTFEAFHPSEVLATALCLGAFAAFVRGRIGWTAALLGFALLTRQWALVVVALVALAAEGRDRLVIVAGAMGTAALGVLPFLVLSPTSTMTALSATDVSRYPVTGPGLLPLQAWALFVLSRYVPLMAAAVLCLWFNRRTNRGDPAVLVAVLTAGLLLRPLVDPAGYLYYLASPFAFAVLVRPTSWRWPVGASLAGVVFYVRRRLRSPFPTYEHTGPDPVGLHAAGGSLSVLMTVMVGAGLVGALREVAARTEPRPVTAAPAFGARPRSDDSAGLPR